jgi:hypothetical protein
VNHVLEREFFDVPLIIRFAPLANSERSYKRYHQKRKTGEPPVEKTNSPPNASACCHFLGKFSAMAETACSRTYPLPLFISGSKFWLFCFF